MLILVDAMGGDHAPEAVVNGCMDAINEMDGFEILLIGDSDRINRIISERKFNNSRLKVEHTTEIITNDDSPTKAIKNKKNSSMVIGFNMLKEKKGQVFISAGNSGALMTGSLLILKRIKGVDRPALPAVIPTKGGKALIIDAGLNTVCKPINFLQFGIMGSLFMKKMFNIENPKVGLLNIGAEEGKGNDLTKQAFPFLSDANINFVGNVEGRDIPEGKVHVVVCDGFVGNVTLKFLEGCATFFFGSLKEIFGKGFISKLAAFLIMKDLKKFKKTLDADEHGGAPILGVNGLVIKSHGSSNAKTIKNVVLKAYNLAKTTILDEIKEEFKNMEVEDIELAN